MLIYRHKAITVHKEGGGGYSDSLIHASARGIFLFKVFIYIILSFFFFFFFGGGGVFRNIHIFGGMKILWIFFFFFFFFWGGGGGVGHDEIGLV